MHTSKDFHKVLLGFLMCAKGSYVVLTADKDEVFC